MAASIQIAENFERVKVFWDYDTSGSVASFNLYWSLSSGGAWTKINSSAIRNTPEWYKKYVVYQFTRASLGLSSNDPLFLYATEVDGVGVEGPPGPIKHISDYRDVPAQAGALNSPIVSSENFSQDIPAATTNIVFSNDAKAVEVFNNSSDIVYLDVTGSPLDIAKAMIIPAGSYYSAQLNIPKDTGIQLYGVADPADTRIVVHY